MKKEKIISRAVVFMLFFAMWMVNVSAEDTTFKLTVGNENVNVEKDALTGEVDYSNLNVNVIKRAGEEKEIVYSGALSGYKDGKYSDIDFGELQIVIVYNKDNPEDTVYIVPAEETTAVASSEIDSMSLVDMQVENTDEVQNAIADEFYHITADASLVYNDVYHESVLLPGNTLGVPVTVTAEGETSVLINCYIATYNEEGNLLTLASNPINVPSNQTITVNIPEEAKSAKIFLWNSENMKSIMDSIELKMQNQDYYADSANDASIFDISKKISGVINSVDDIDYIKFIPNESGTYIIHGASDANVLGYLYDEQGNLISAGTQLDGGYYFKEVLNAADVYYLKTSGSTVGEYNIAINKTESNTVVITNDSILFKQEYESSKLININLLDSTGQAIQTYASMSDNNKISAEFVIDNIQSEYGISVVEDGNIVALYDINIMSASQEFHVTPKSYVSVPVSVTNATDLSDIYFSVAFNENEFNIYDVCEYTYNIAEVGEGLISAAEVNINAIYNNVVAFTSIKSLSQAWSGTVNTIKLQATGSDVCNVETYIYKVK